MGKRRALPYLVSMHVSVSNPKVAQGRREQAKEMRRQALLAAAKLSLANGEFSMRRVAELAGVSEVTPYNLFGSKGGMLAALYRERIAENEARLPPPGEIDPLARFLLAIDDFHANIATHPAFYRAFSAARLESSGGRMHGDSTDEGVDFYERLIQAVINAGQIKSGPSASLLSRHFIQLLSGAMYEWLDNAVSLDHWHAMVVHGAALIMLPLASPEASVVLKQRLKSSALYLTS